MAIIAGLTQGLCALGLRCVRLVALWVFAGVAVQARQERRQAAFSLERGR
ncbi:MAG: hypothetical protein IPO15_14150 [Anaerolineae bacterium]|nr:hypothetical protein [Anaerolineae bacterium]